MAAASLKRYSATLSTTGTTTVVPAVGTARALVISKITVAAFSASTITLSVGGSGIVLALPLTAGQVYTETGLVVPAGETVTAQAGTASALIVNVFGEEVDN